MAQLSEEALKQKINDAMFGKSMDSVDDIMKAARQYAEEREAKAKVGITRHWAEFFEDDSMDGMPPSQRLHRAANEMEARLTSPLPNTQPTSSQCFKDCDCSCHEPNTEKEE